jgi:hypothetical protein
LDKFVFRNPKKHDKIKGSDTLLQPRLTSEPGRVVIKKGTGISKDELNVNSKEFWTMKLENVPVDQVFYLYLFYCNSFYDLYLIYIIESDFFPQVFYTEACW